MGVERGGPHLHFHAVALGHVAGGGEDALHLARFVAIDRGVVEHVYRAAGNVADRQGVVAHEALAQHLPVAGTGLRAR